MRYLITRIDMPSPSSLNALAIKEASSADAAIASLIAERGYGYLTPEVLYARPVGRVSYWHPELPVIIEVQTNVKTIIQPRFGGTIPVWAV
jgi:hypothetical protein